MWEWSHTAEGLANARQNVHALEKDTLLEILAEWQETDKKLAKNEFLHDLPKDVLADTVWTKMEELRTCTNGGHEAYCCPSGCHTVPFDLPEGVELDPDL